MNDDPINRSRGYTADRYACDDGHILYTDNVWIDSKGYIKCKACDSIYSERPDVIQRKREANKRRYYRLKAS